MLLRLLRWYPLVVLAEGDRGLCCAAQDARVGRRAQLLDDGACLLQSHLELESESEVESEGSGSLSADVAADADAGSGADNLDGGADSGTMDIGLQDMISADSGLSFSSEQALAAASAARAAESSGDFMLDEDEPFRQSMVNFGDAQYISYLVIGHQLIGGILDTGSFELVVFSSTCSSCGSAGQYNPWLSSSYGVGQLKTTQSYGSGDTFSEEAFDLVSIGPFADTNQSFWEVTKANMPILNTAMFQGIIGVGPPETPAADAWNALMRTAGNISNMTDIHAPVDENLLAQAVDRLEVAMEVTQRPTLLRNLNVSIFSMCVSRKPGDNGFFIWNDYTAVRKPLLFAEVPVVGTHTWSVELKNVRIRGSLDKGSSKNAVKEIGCGDGCSAIIDSGTSLLAVPGFIIEQLQDMMEQLDTDCSNLHELPSLVFNMGDGQFTLPPDSYVAEVVGQLPNYLEGYTTMETEHNSSESMSEADPADGVGKRGSRSRCQLLLMESYASTKYGPLWILGIPFFRRYYTTFRIGESHKDRTLFMAPSTDDCYVEGQEDGQASFLDVGSRDTYLRTINASFIHAPVLAQRAIQSGFMHL